jgi:Tfp pilus assembly protein PilF
VSARLVDATNGYQIWSDEYQRNLTDVFSVQDDLARAIVSALRLHLAPGGGTSPVRRGTKDVDAYNKYLRGRYAFEKRTYDGFTRGVQYFSEAIAVDSNYAAAYSGLADCYMLMTTFGYVPPRVLMPKAKAAAERAVALDSMNAEARTSLGFVYLLYDFDYPRGEAQLRRAIELNPRYATALLFNAWYYAAVDKPDDAVREAQRALAIDPFSIILNSRVGTMLYFAGKYQAAADQEQRTLELAPQDGIALNNLARAYLKLGRCADAMKTAKQAEPFVGPWEGPVLGYVASQCGDRALAQHELKARLDEVDQGKYVPADVLAKLYAGLGDKTRALDWLERAYQDRIWSMTLLPLEPMYDNLRGEPRFQSLVRKMNPQ